MRTAEEYREHLIGAGWSAGEYARGNGRVVWVAGEETVIFAVAANRVEAWRRACEQAGAARMEEGLPPLRPASPEPQPQPAS